MRGVGQRLHSPHLRGPDHTRRGSDLRGSLPVKHSDNFAHLVRTQYPEQGCVKLSHDCVKTD